MEEGKFTPALRFLRDVEALRTDCASQMLWNLPVVRHKRPFQGFRLVHIRITGVGTMFA